MPADPHEGRHVLAPARRAFRQIYPDATAPDADATVASVAEAMFVLLQHEGLLGAGRTVRPDPRRERRR